MTRESELKNLLKEEPPFRHKQLLYALYSTPALNADSITTLPAHLKAKLKNSFPEGFLTLKPLKTDRVPQADKWLFELKDGERIEAVRMCFKEGLISLCASTQVGCGCGCAFCETGKIGFKRHLSSDEIVDQILFFLKQGIAIRNVSFMGMGEALLNPNLYEALSIITHKDKLAFSPRRLTVSTVGITKGIYALTKDFPQVTLTFSLHSPFDEERNVLVPLNRSHPLDEVFSALEDHIEKTRKKTYLAYLVLSGKNDTLEHVKKIDHYLTRKNLKSLYHLNLIRYNGTHFSTTKESLERFKKMLDAKKIHYTLRQSFGSDILAACGQLAAGYSS